MKLCCFFNINSHYRYPIYHEIDRSYDCDWYFGNSIFEKLKQFDPYLLKGFKKYLPAKKFLHGYFTWHSGAWSMLDNQYSAYLLTGTPDIFFNWIIIIYAKLFGKKLYCWGHGLKHEIIHPFWKLYFRLFYKSMDGIFMYNSRNCKFMEKLGCQTERLHVIYNSLDYDTQTAIYKLLSPSYIYNNYFGNSDPVIIYIGRIQKRKKLDLLIDAFNNLLSKGHKANLVIVGGSSDDETIHNMVIKYSIENRVWFYGPSFEEEKNAELLFNASVCVCPAEVGLTVIHALTYGTPTISNDNFETQMPEFEAIVDGITGSFYKENQIDDLENEIMKWINISPSEREQVRFIARKTIENCWNHHYQIQLIKKIIKNN